MKKDSLVYVQERLALMDIKALKSLAKASLVPYWTLYKIRIGVVSDPHYSTVMRLHAALKETRK